MADCVVGQRQQREGAGGIENFVGDVLVVALVVEGADDRRVVVLPARDADPGRLPGRRLAPLRGDQQRRAGRAAAELLARAFRIAA